MSKTEHRSTVESVWPSVGSQPVPASRQLDPSNLLRHAVLRVFDARDLHTIGVGQLDVGKCPFDVEAADDPRLLDDQRAKRRG